LYAITVESGFEASHRLKLADGSTEPLHSHNWKVVAEVAAEKLNCMGVVMDFHHLKAILNAILASITETGLDKIEYFQQNSSSAESVARYIYEQLAGQLPNDVKLRSVAVTEASGCIARFAK